MKLKQLTFLFLFVLLTASGLLQAGVQSTATVTGTDKGVNVTLPAPFGNSVFSGTFKATVNGNPTSLYCIDLHHYLVYNSPYQDVESTNDTLSYILNNYYPFQTSYPGKLTDVREASAVQLALWHLTDGLDITLVTGSSISDIKTRALAIVADALLNAHSFNLNTFVINIPPQSFAIGSPITFTVQAFNDDGLAMPNVQVALSTTLGSLSQTTVTTGITGVTPVVTLTPVSGQTTATITATGVVGIPSGTKYYHVANPNGQQKLILATPTIASRTITAAVNWCNSFNLVISKVADKTVVNEGDIITYTIKVKNTGTGNAQNIQVSDQLASVLDFISCTPSGVYNPTTGIWNVGTVNAHDSASLEIKVKVNYGNTSAPTYDLGAATEFNLFVIDTLIQPSSDTEGKVAVGGYADLRNYSVGDKLPANSGDVLVVGNHLTFFSGRVYNGRTTYENFITSTTQFTSDEGIFQDTVLDFSGAENHLLNLSNQLSNLAETDTVGFEWGNVQLTGT
ncbi:MAG: collagen-binding domain-containing protein, partial [Ignavibacteriaceae bacterium]